MSRNLPTVTPAEILSISPEALEVANTYLQCQDIVQVAETLNISTDLVTTYLNKPDVKAYIATIFMDLGYNNQFKLRSALDAIISKKFEEMDEAGIGSTKDIADLLELSAKISHKYMELQIKLEEAKNKTKVRNQTNVQINDASGGTNYGNLLEKLMKNDITKDDDITDI